MISENELAKLAYADSEKLWASLTVRMKGETAEAVRRLASVDHRPLQKQVLHLLEVGIRTEIVRLEREASEADQIRTKVARRMARDYRRALTEAFGRR
jgi:hypothetical protein